MKIAIIGSRRLVIKDLQKHIPPYTSEIVSGGAKGVDQSAKNYAIENGIKYTEFLPNYKRYGKGAPIKRNVEIIDYSDEVIAIWDGISQGTLHVINTCKKLNKPLKIVLFNK